MPIMDRDRTDYSDEIAGSRGNYNWPVRFDMSGTGFLGISQFENGVPKERVLLSPKQVKELLAFVRARQHG